MSSRIQNISYFKLQLLRGSESYQTGVCQDEEVQFEDQPFLLSARSRLMPVKETADWFLISLGRVC